MQLSPEEKAEIIRLIEEGKPLPAKYRYTLFENGQGMELLWEGKSREICRDVLPLYVTERVGAAAAEKGENGWTDKLIPGDNRLILSSLIHGPMRKGIEKAGGIKLIYIDPPFDSGTDYSMETGTEKPLTAYRDTWGEGKDSFLSMLHERLRLMHELLAPGGSLFIHCDWHVNSAVRLMLDEIFGPEMHRNEIVFAYGAGGNPKNHFPRKHDTLYWYAKGGGNTFNRHAPILRTPYDPSTLTTHFRQTDEAGRRYRVQRKNGRDYITYEDKGKLVTDVWTDIGAQNATSPISKEYTGYPTQKPEKLLTRILTAATNEGDLAADFFCGSGTMAAAAMKLGRRWIAADLGKHAIQTACKRLAGIQKQLLEAGKEPPTFEVLTMGRYERSYRYRVHMPEGGRGTQTVQKDADITGMILRAYGAEEAEGNAAIRGLQDGRGVMTGPADRPVTREDITPAIRECRERGLPGLDVLGYEYEMDIWPGIREEARMAGIGIALRYIPEDLSGRRAAATAFHDVHCIQCSVEYREGCASVTLTGFHPCRSNAGENTGWAEWIDSWAVDPDYGRRKQFIHVQDEQGEPEERWTGGYVFQGAWRTCRTKQNKGLELCSGSIPVKPDAHAIAVKVVDVCGYETMAVFQTR